MGKLLRLIIFVFGVLQPPCLLYGAWQGPHTVLSGSFGGEPGQFFFVGKETTDFFPRNFGIDSKGTVFINDNGRIQIFDGFGTLKKIILRPDAVDARDVGWPAEIIVHPKGQFLARSGKNHEVSFFDDNYNYIKSVKSYGDIYSVDNGYVFNNYENGCEHYDLDGNLLSTFTELPSYLQNFNIKSDDNLNKKMITIFGKIFTVPNDVYVSRCFVGSDLNYIYVYGRGSVIKIGICGHRIGQWELPSWSVFQSDNSTSNEPYEFVHTEYGDPIVDANGNIYTYEKTPSHYSILKWEWVDDLNDPQPGPDVPVNLKLTPSLDGLYLTWGASPQDPGCVDGYDLERSTSVDGIFTSVSTTDPGVLIFNDTGALPGDTYFYKVRARSGNLYSPYSAVVSGSR